jgi:uncharacterized membrane protein
MVPLIVMALGILISRALGSLGVEWFISWKTCVRVGLAAMFVFTGVAHFNKIRRDLVKIVPPFFSNPEALVTVTGLAEFAGAVGLILTATARLAAYVLIALLIVMLPANIYAARQRLLIAGRPATPLLIRVPLQAVWIGLLWWASHE